MKLIARLIVKENPRDSSIYAWYGHLYEAQPTKRTIIGINLNGQRNRYYVSFPWTYFLVSFTNKERPWSSVAGEGWTFGGLMVYIRPGPMTHTDELLFSLNFPNGNGGAMCLGKDMPTGMSFHSVETMCSKAIGLFFETPFEHEIMNIPLQDPDPNIANFAQWKEVSKTIKPPDFIPIDFRNIPSLRSSQLYNVLWSELPIHAQPRYTHDCARCVFLGLYEEFDLYYCLQGNLPTVVARYGNEGADYLSGMGLATFVDNDSHPLVEARSRAMQTGLNCNAS